MADILCLECHTIKGKNGCHHKGYNPGVFIKQYHIEAERASAKAERDEFELFCKRHNCNIRGCIYGNVLNDYCICCGSKRPIANPYEVTK